jgi:hypothetical protein
MGKAPTREYPYIKDALLGKTLYIGIDDVANLGTKYFNNTTITKVVFPPNSNITSLPE